MVFRTKVSVKRFKVRLVILGCRQRCNINYLNTFSFVPKMNLTYQTDVFDTFLHRDLEEEVHMNMPQSYTHYGVEITPVCA